uniref:Craniofacial development protein 2 n=1 Tax=Cacopsylla melanoneura TaxID=428564 RepID=A0A8D9E7Z9_9HEMI
MKVNSGSIIYGDCGETHELGTGFFVHDTLMDAVKEFKSVHNRLSMMTVAAQWFDITFLNVHAPCEDAEDEVKDQFYGQLEMTYNAVPRRNIIVVLGDLNAKFGKENVFIPTIGNHSLHDTTNDNGGRFINFALGNNIIIASTKFEHKNIHKGTWVAPNGTTVNQIDHIAIQKRFINSIKDVRTYRGADCDSDHFMVVARMNIKLKKMNRGNHKKMNFCVSNFNDMGTRERYVTAIETRIAQEPTEEVQGSVNENWKDIREAIHEVSRSTLNKRRKKNKCWFNEACTAKVEERKAAKLRWLDDGGNETIKQEYYRIRRETQRFIRRTKREYYNSLIREAEDDFTHHRSRQMYQNLKRATKGYTRRETFVKDQQGNVITNQDEIAKRWVEYFSQLLSAEEPEQTLDFVFPVTVDREVRPPTFDDLKEIVSKLKNNKSCGEDEIFTELLKYGGDELIQRLRHLMDIIWEHERMPDEWKTAIITPIHKKNDPLMCDNYRGIALLNVTYKILSLLILRRLAPLSEEIIGDYQRVSVKGSRLLSTYSR